MNIRKRLVVWHSLILAGFLLVFTVGLYMALNFHLYTEIDESLSAWVTHIAESLSGTGRLSDSENRSNPGGGLPYYNMLDSFVVLIDPNGEITSDRTVLEKDDLERLQRFLEGRTINPQGSYTTITLKKQPFRIFIIDLSGWKIRDQRILILGRSLMHVRETLTSLFVTLALAWVGAVVVCFVISWIFVGRTLRPVKIMTAEALKIAASGELNRQINHLDTNDEFGHLAKALNCMLTSLEGSYSAMKQFLADASHELRTPLTSIKANLEFLKRAAAAPEDLKNAALCDTIAEADRMAGLVNELLQLARAEVPASFIFKTVDLTEIVKEAALNFQNFHQQKAGKRISYEAAGPALIRGDREKLRQGIIILLDNAIKYTPPGGMIHIKLRSAKIQTILEITDNGPGIPAEEINRVFDRFYRATNVRGQITGSGLGLSIVKQIVVNHGGAISLQNIHPHGLKAIATFPTLNNKP